MGALPHLKTFLAKGSKGFARLGADDKEGVLQCECGGGVQDAVHLWKECAFTHGVRLEVLERCQEVVEDKGNARELAMWDNMGEEAKLAHVVGGKTWAGEAVEKGWREVAAGMWVQSGQEVLNYFERANKGFEGEVRGLLG